MPLNVEVKGQPGEARRVAEYLRRKSQAVQQATEQAQDATNASDGGWHGEAGPAFREVMGRTIPAVDGVSGDHADLCRVLEDHAGELDGVKERMERALRVARDAGLQATEKQIMEPHPAPAGPMPLPADKPATPEQQQQHAAGCAARADHARKVQAYQECGRVVDDARKTENNAANTLIDFVKGLVEKSPFTISSTAAGTIGAFAGNASKLREEAQKVMNSPRATVSAQLMHNTNMSPQGWGRAAAINAEEVAKSHELERQASATKMAQWVDRLPTRVKNAAEAGFIPKSAEFSGSKAISLGSKLTGRLPIAGTFITTMGVGYDASQGKDVAKSAVSGYGSQLAGAAATGALVAFTSTPVGWAVGLGVVGSIGVGTAIDALWD